MISLKKWSKTYAAGLLFLSLSPYSHAGNEPIVKITDGAVQGTSNGVIDAFKGIPYAKAPVNELRWRKPQQVTPWDGVLDASDYKPDCMQKPFPGDAAPLGTGTSEDCLYMNVWKPSESDKPLPVVVWIYGGGFVNGGSSPTIYSGHKFAEQDVVFVSFNYRVGRFGFFAHPKLTKANLDGVLGNYGFMDQIAALQWVKQNISAFGGDPKRVTVMGESAGGFSVHTLLTSPLAKGLFNQAIIQSGGGRTALGTRYLSKTNAMGQPSAEQVGVAFAKRMGIKPNDPDALQKLRQLPAEDIVSGLNMATMADPTYSGTIIDGTLVVDNPQSYYSANKDLAMPLMVGTTDYEIGFPPQNVATVDDALSVFGSKLSPENYKLAVKGYVSTVGDYPQDIAQAVSSDFLMVEPARFVEREASKQSDSVYAYRFSYVVDSEKSQLKGAPHATDIPYAFNTVSDRYSEISDRDKQVSDAMNKYWVNFIKTGSPNGKGLPEWTPYSSTNDKLMIFSNQGIGDFGMKSDSWKTRLDMVEFVQK